MFITLLVINFAVAFAVCFVIDTIFRRPIRKILERLITEDIHYSWSRYIMFAIYVVGISGGVRVWDLEKYMLPAVEGGESITMTSEHWVLEIYRTVIGTLQADAWMLLVFFIFCLVAFVIVKAFEARRSS